MSDEQPGFRSIGSQVQKTVNSLRAKVSTQTPPPLNSATTGTPSPVMPPNSIGALHGATGVAAKTADLATALALADPMATDDSLKALLPPSVRRSLTCIESPEGVCDPVYGFDPIVVGFQLSRPVAEVDLTAARDLVKAAIAPATPPTIAQELARLRAMTKSRDQGDDLALVFGALREELAIFPPDVVRASLRKIARREKFFPSLSELRDQCQRASRYRWHLADALGLDRPKED